MLHLACHGFTSASAGTAYLLLAGGDRLTAETLGAVMARNPARAIGLVVLAACRTGRTISGYDEAYSLGTAFLAAGVRSVLSTQWSVPDRATSVLMFMFHHYLMAGGRPVWAALREAQLWMLDPRRQVPSGMPDELRAQLAGADLTAVAAWAGFVHWGQ
jgi:CHAT domain-containing protein